MKITVTLADVPAFCARYGLSTVRTGRIVDGLPECRWEPEPGQTKQQAALVAAELKDGMRWDASKFSLALYGEMTANMDLLTLP